MISEYLDCEVVCTHEKPQSSVIWCHGLGADGHDFKSLVPYLGLAEETKTRFVFPHAPVQPITLNGGFPMRAWYDIYELALGSREDEHGIAESASELEKLITRENSLGIPANRIVLAGFSQGGAMALYVGLNHNKKLAGILALSCYLPLADHLSEKHNLVNQRIPILMAHGIHDPVVPIDWAHRSRDRLQALGYPVEWQEYPIDHSVSPNEVVAIGKWLTKVLK